MSSKLTPLKKKVPKNVSSQCQKRITQNVCHKGLLIGQPISRTRFILRTGTMSVSRYAYYQDTSRALKDDFFQRVLDDIRANYEYDSRMPHEKKSFLKNVFRVSKENFTKCKKKKICE